MVEYAERIRPESLVAFGLLVKRLRLARDLTQEELAARAYVSTRLISDLERGGAHRPRRDTVQLLADGLQLAGLDREAFIALALRRCTPAIDPPPPTEAPEFVWPLPPAPIIGRLHETAAVTALLLRPEVRLVTLTGPGGVGKTRLALEVGPKVTAAFPDGAVYVDLVPVSDASLLRHAIIQAIGHGVDPEQLAGDGLETWLADRRLLLALDNFEHLIAGATTVAGLLAAAPGLTVLATSREPLRLRAERQYDLAPLALPDLGRELPVAELAQVPAVGMFVDRAEVANRSFALTAENGPAVADIVTRLDGLPLALELAAARLRIMSPAALRDRLERRLPLLTGGAVDLPARQQALRATIAWSYDLLAPDERRLFRRLAVFDGGFSLEAVEATVPEEPESALDVLGGLTALIEKNLVRVLSVPDDGRRFQMLETIREFGLDALAEAGETDEAQARHAGWYASLAERAAPMLTGAEQGLWFTRLEREQGNLRAALRWAIAAGNAELAMRFGGALYRYWTTHGFFDEGHRWLDQILTLAPEDRSGQRGHCLIGAGVLDYFTGRYQRAEARWEAAKAIFEAVGDLTGVAYAFGNLGLIGDATSDYPRAVANYETALALFRRLDDQTHTGFMLHNLGLIAHFEGDQERATALFEEALALSSLRDDRHGMAITLGNLGLVAFVQGDYARARALQSEALELGRGLVNKPWLAKAVEQFALIAAATGRAERAARLFAAASAFRAQIGAAVAPNDDSFRQPYLAAVRAELGECAFAAVWAEGEATTLDDAVTIALSSGDG